MTNELLGYLFKKILEEGINQSCTVCDVLDGVAPEIRNDEIIFNGHKIWIRTYSGASRLCLTFGTEAKNYIKEINNWVVKVDMSQCEGSTAKEVTVYERTLKEAPEFADFLCKTFYGGIVNEMPFYVMEYVECDEDEVIEIGIDEWRRTEDYAYWMEDCYNNDVEPGDVEYEDFTYFEDDEQTSYYLKGLGYDWELVERFYEWMNHLDVNDLHTGNIGTRNDGTPAFIDFAGYGCKSVKVYDDYPSKSWVKMNGSLKRVA